MSDNTFTNVFAMEKKKTLDVFYVYYIEEMNGFLYVADRRMTLGSYRSIVENGEDYIIIAQNFGDYESRKKYYKSKEAAQKALERK
jgi:hypothetical protein